MTVHHRLRRTAARLCGPKTMERLIDPMLADLQMEYETAIADGRVWRSRRVRMAGCYAFVKVMALCAYERSARDWSGDDGRAMTRTAGLTGAAFVVTASLLILPPAVQVVPAGLLPYLIPQALPLALPVGITLGIFCGLGGRVVPFRLKGASLALALACSVGSFAATAWMIPAAGQGFRVSVSERVRLTTGKEVTLSTGPLEMTMSELRRAVDSPAQPGRARDARKMAFVYYLRWALPCAPFVLALFALSSMPRRPVRGWILAAAGSGACLSYYILLLAADLTARRTQLPIAASAWLPNLVLAAASMVLLVVARNTPRLGPGTGSSFRF